MASTSPARRRSRTPTRSRSPRSIGGGIDAVSGGLSPCNTSVVGSPQRPRRGTIGWESDVAFHSCEDGTVHSYEGRAVGRSPQRPLFEVRQRGLTRSPSPQRLPMVLHDESSMRSPPAPSAAGDCPRSACEGQLSPPGRMGLAPTGLIPGSPKNSNKIHSGMSPSDVVVDFATTRFAARTGSPENVPLFTSPKRLAPEGFAVAERSPRVHSPTPPSSRSPFRVPVGVALGSPNLNGQVHTALPDSPVSPSFVVSPFQVDSGLNAGSPSPKHGLHSENAGSPTPSFSGFVDDEPKTPGSPPRLPKWVTSPASSPGRRPIQQHPTSPLPPSPVRSCLSPVVQFHIGSSDDEAESSVYKRTSASEEAETSAGVDSDFSRQNNVVKAKAGRTVMEAEGTLGLIPSLM